MKYLRNNKGSFGLISMAAFTLAIVGAWAMYHWYQDGSLNQKISDLVSDVTNAIRDFKR